MRSRLMQYCSGPPMQNRSGVDTFARATPVVEVDCDMKFKEVKASIWIYFKSAFPCCVFLL